MRWIIFAAVFAMLASVTCAANQPWITFEGSDAANAPGKGKHIVLISGDDEYRSEEALPQLAKILSEHHGFKTTVLFAIDPATGEINPQVATNIPGLEQLKSADLMIMFLRFRNLPDEQMKHIEQYVKSGKPIIAMRTSTHAFNLPEGGTYTNWHWKNAEGEWQGGFGKRIFGETWVSHHGKHKHEATRGLIAPGSGPKDHPIVRGIQSGDIWGATDVYTVNLPLPGDSKPLVLGQVLERAGEMDKDDVNFGMRPTDPPLEGEKNDPMMPVAWIKSYEYPGGRGGVAFVTTMGSATDLANEGFRRLLVNAAYYLSELPVPAKSKVDLVGEYKPSAYGFKGHVAGRKAADYR